MMLHLSLIVVDRRSDILPVIRSFKSSMIHLLLLTRAVAVCFPAPFGRSLWISTSWKVHMPLHGFEIAACTLAWLKFIEPG